MIILRSLKAHNFKGLREIDLVLPRQGAILVSGSNEAGKSTLFEAIYFALYGALLVTDDNKGALQDGIAYDSETANINLTLEVGGTILIVNRAIRRKGAQVATLTIDAPGHEQEDVAGVKAVNCRLLGELGGLDGAALLNSCFVEQKKLSKLEDLSYADREHSMLQLLNLEHMSELEQEYKIRQIDREQLDLAQGRARVAELRQEVANLTAQLARLALERAAGEYMQALGSADMADRTAAEAEEARNPLLRQLSEVEGLLEAVERAHTAQRIVGDAQVLAQRLSGELVQVADQRAVLDNLDQRERVELPALRLTVTELQHIAAGVRCVESFRTQADEARTRAERAIGALRHASNLAQALESARAAVTQAETDCRQRARDLAGREQARSTDLPATQIRIRQLQHLAAQDHQLHALVSQIPVEEAARDRAHHVHAELLTERTRAAVGAAAAEVAAHAADDAEARLLKARTDLAQIDELAALSDWLAAQEADRSMAPLAAELDQARADLKRAESMEDEVRVRSQQARRRIIFAGCGTAALVIVLAVALGLHVVVLLAVAGVALFGAAGTSVILALRSAKLARALASSTQWVATIRDHSHALELRHAAVASDDVAARRRALAAERLTTLKAQIPMNEDDASVRIQRLASGTVGPANREEVVSRVQGEMEAAGRARAAAERAVGLAEASRTRLAVLEAESRDLALQTAEQRLSELQARIADQEHSVLEGKHALGLSPSDGPSQALGAVQSEKDRLAVQVEGIPAAAEDLERAREGCRQLISREQAIAVESRAIDRPALELERACAGENADALDSRREQDLRAIHPLLSAYQLEPDLVEVERRVAETEQKLRHLEVELALRAEKEARYQGFRAKAESTRQEGLALIMGISGTLEEAGCAIPLDFTAQILTALRGALVSHLDRLDEAGLNRRRHQIMTDIDQAQETIQTQTAQAVLWRRIAAENEQAIRQALEETAALALLAEPPPLGAVLAAIDEAEDKRLVETARETDAAAKWQLVGVELGLEDCAKVAHEMKRNHAVRVIACKLLKEARTHMVQRVLPNTERNMRMLLPLLTENRYLDAQITDYQIRVWDDRAQSFKSKSIFSGGTKDQFSLALRLSFALAALPQELGTTPGFIFLDEVMSAADDRRALAIQELLTRGPVADNFAQILVVSHGKVIDTTLFPYRLVLANGKVVESNLPLEWETYSALATDPPLALATAP